MKRLLFALLYYSGVTRFAAWWNRSRVAFLCYHGVTKSPGPLRHDPKGLHVHYERFAKQLAYLQKHYHVVSLDEYVAAADAQRKLPEYSVVLTFDDGFRNFLTAAAPLLIEQKIPATVFLITDHTGSQNGDRRSKEWTPEDDLRYLSWNEARELKDKYGFEFGSHTCSHSRLLTLSPIETERELLHSFKDLVANLKQKKPSLSYPKGEYSEILAADARKLGYACAVTTDRGINESGHDRFTLGRTLIGDNDDEASFAVRVSGLRWWLVLAVSALGRQKIPAHHTAQPPATTPARGLQLTD